MMLSQAIITQAVKGFLPDFPDTGIHDLLTTVGTAVFQSQAGFTPKKDDNPLPEPCPPDEGDYCSDEILAFYHVIHKPRFRHGVYRREFRGLFEAYGYRLPEEFILRLDTSQLPLNIDLNRIPYIGQRGKCVLYQQIMAQQVDTSANRVQFSGFFEKAFFLTELRYHDPATARQYLREWWPPLDTYQRAILIRVLKVNLSVDDEPLLAELVTTMDMHYRYERRMKRYIARALYDLPGSQLRTLVDARIESLLAYDSQTGTISRSDSQKLSTRFALDSIYHAWGIRLQTALEMAPPRYWMIRWNLTCEQFIAATLNSNFMRQQRRRIWFNAALRTGDAEYVKNAFYGLVNTLGRNPIEKMSYLLSGKTCTDLALYMLNHSKRPFNENRAFHFLRYQRPGFDSDQVLTRYFECIQAAPAGVTQERGIWILYALMHYIPPHRVDDYLTLCDQLPTTSDYERESMTRLIEQANLYFDFRQEMHDAFQRGTA